MSLPSASVPKPRHLCGSRTGSRLIGPLTATVTLNVLLLLPSPCECAFAANQPPPPTPQQEPPPLLEGLSRRDAILLSAGAVAYGKITSDAVSRLARGISYPEEHERRVSDTFCRTLTEAAGSGISSGEKTQRRPLRVLEVGVGTDLRTVRRGLYDSAVGELKRRDDVSGLEWMGVDLGQPKPDALVQAREALRRTGSGSSSSSPWDVSLDVIAGDLTEKLPYPDGHFDAVTCCLTLCSVTDQRRALREIKRLVNPKGGTFGYVEHVAVRLDEEGEENRQFLDWQQRTLDPIQQVVADNCHLHRDTDLAIWNVFGIRECEAVGGETLGSDDSLLLQKERFFVEDMWPVTCQCCGVVQMLA